MLADSVLLRKPALRLYLTVGSHTPLDNMGSKSGEQVRDEMVEKLGHDFGRLLNSLYNEISWLTFKWIEFRELYGTKESRFDIMNKTAPFFFSTIQKVLWENLLLGVARITDPPQTAGKKNTTLRALGQHIKDEEFKIEFEKEISEILTASEFCRDWRNRWIAHMDYELSINRDSAVPLQTANRWKLRTTLEKIQALYNKVSFRYLNSSTPWEMLSSHTGAVSLLYRLQDGLRFDEEQYLKKLSGQWTGGNFESKV